MLLHGNELLLRIKRHLMNGLPVCFEGQLHTGLCFTTWQSARTPQVPGQGSMHFWLTQAFCNEHSKLVTHSGLHAGGLPKNPGMQEQTACPFISLHWLLEPHGDGLQGLITSEIVLQRLLGFFITQVLTENIYEWKNSTKIWITFNF